MKRLNVKRILAIVCYSLVLVTLYNCNEESIIENPQENKVLVEDIDFDNFYKKQEFKDFYNQVIDNKKTLRRGTQNIGISTSLIKHIKNKELETYTFSVEKKNLAPNQFENLVITKNLSTNEISAAFLKYDMSTELLLDSNGKPYPFQGTLEVVPVAQENIEGLLSKSTTVCYNVGVLMCNDNRGEYSSDHQVTEACKDPSHIYTAQSIECNTVFSAPSFTDETDGGGGSVPIDSGTSGGSSSSTTTGGTSLITALIPPTLKEQWFEMTEKLTDQQQRFLYKLENSDIRKKLGEFFENNNFSKEAEKLVIEIIEILANGGDVDLDNIICEECSDTEIEEQVTCSPGQIKNHEGKCVVDPCKFIKLQIQNPNYTEQARELKRKVGLKQETGYQQEKDGRQIKLEVEDGGHAVDIKTGRETVGFIHTHLNNFTKYNSRTRREEEVKPIKMFSPADILSFLEIAKRSRFNGVPQHLVYGTLISSSGVYTLRFTGNPAFNSFNLKSAKEYKESYKTLFENNGKEKAFLLFLKNEINVPGIDLYRIRDNGDVEKKTLDDNGRVKTNDC